VSIELITILLFGSMLALLVTGLPIAWILGGITVIFALTLWGTGTTSMAFFGVEAVMGYGVLVCVPMFIFMGMVLSQCGLVDKFYDSMLNWFGFLPGSLSVVTVGVSAVMAAMVGSVEPATLTMGTISLPVMLRKGYNKNIAIGCIQAGAALGFLIPPSVIAVLYAIIAKQSIGQLFAGGLIPGIMLAVMFITYIIIRCSFQRHLAPIVPREDRANWRKKIVSLQAVILQTAVVFLVLGSILAGIATPVEAASWGVVGSLVAGAITRRLNWKVISNAASMTIRLTCIASWIFMAALSFGKVYQALGAPELIQGSLEATALGPIGILVIMQLSYFVMGMILDDTAILFICLPLYIPIARALGFDLVWFGVLYLVNMQMAYLTPPFGYCLFLMKSVVPKDISMGDIYKSVWPFVTIQGLGVILCIAFPQIVLWVPHILFGRPM